MRHKKAKIGDLVEWNDLYACFGGEGIGLVINIDEQKAGNPPVVQFLGVSDNPKVPKGFNRTFTISDYQLEVISE
tara:strand:- start:17 stop:241 length:225 start_codon:yes stop_codon:yes gene_type:complete